VMAARAVARLDAAASGAGAGLLRFARNDGDRLIPLIHLFCGVAKIA